MATFSEENVQYFYKYMPFTEMSGKVITEGTIKFSCPLDFNDPFDCFPNYDSEVLNELPKKRPDIFKRFAEDQKLSPAKRLAKKSVLLSKLRRSLEDGSFARNLMKRTGVVCLSSSPLNNLMWSHYADCHRGIVVEFRTPFKGCRIDQELATDRLYPFPIEYSEQRPKIALHEEGTFDLVKRMALRKSSEWKYEQEARVVDHKRGPGIYRYRREEILWSIIAGLRISDEDLKRLKNYAELATEECGREIPVYRVQESPLTYVLAVPAHPRLKTT